MGVPVIKRFRYEGEDGSRGNPQQTPKLLPLLPSGPDGVHNPPFHGARPPTLRCQKYGGERGIRTPGTPLRAYTRFPVVLLQPLGHLSIRVISWRRGGDSNPREGLWPPNRFRVDPVTTTSVPLRVPFELALISFLRGKIYSKFHRILPPAPRPLRQPHD